MVDILSVSCQTPSNQFDITQSFLFIVAHKISRIICYENKNNKISRELLKFMKKNYAMIQRRISPCCRKGKSTVIQ